MFRKRFVTGAALLVAAGSLSALVVPAQAYAASTQYSFTADAFATSAVVGSSTLGAGSGRSVYEDLGCTVRPQSHTNSVAGLSIPLIDTTTGALTSTVSSAHNSSTGVWSDSASSSVTGISALNGLIQATKISASASASESPSGPAASGSVTLAGLTIGGTSIAVSPEPNTKLTVAGIGTITLNAQKVTKTSGRALMNVDAIDIVLSAGNGVGAPAGATITIGHALATVGGPVSGLLSGDSFSSSLTGNSTVTSGPGFEAFVTCDGTNGTITSKGAGVSAGPLSVGMVTDTAEGTDTASALSATSTSRIANASLTTLLASVLSLTAIKVTASASATGGTVTKSGSVTIDSLSVLGIPITLPTVIPANFSIPLVGGTLTLNRQVPGASGMLVEGIYLTLPSIGTVIIGSASAYA